MPTISPALSKKGPMLSAQILEVLQGVAAAQVGSDLGPARERIEELIAAEREACAVAAATIPCNPPDHTMADDNDDDLARMEADFIDGFQTAREQAAAAIRSRT